MCRRAKCFCVHTYDKLESFCKIVFALNFPSQIFQGKYSMQISRADHFVQLPPIETPFPWNALNPALLDCAACELAGGPLGWELLVAPTPELLPPPI